MDPSYSNPAFGAGAGGQPQQPVFGGGGTQAPVSSGTGGIVLAPEKKSHKGVIIALIVAALIIGGLFAAVFFMRSGGNGVASGDARSAFNKYANYILYGEDSDKALEGEYDAEQAYEIYNIQAAQEKEKEEFFEKASGLLNNFESLIGETTQELISATEDYRGDFELARIISDWDGINDDELWRMVLANNSADTVDEWINDRYKVFSSSANKKVRQFGEDEIAYYKELAEYLEEARAAGCLEGVGVFTCDSFSNEETREKIIEDSYLIDENREEIENNVVLGCWSLRDLLDGKKDDTEEVEE